MPTKKYDSPYGKDSALVQLVNIQKAAQFAAHRRAFDASMCMARWVSQFHCVDNVHGWTVEAVWEQTTRRNYVIYSGTSKYAKPLFVFDEHAVLWFENTDTLYGKVTTRQRKRLRPAGDIHKFDSLTVEAISLWGFAEVAKRRMDRKRDWRTELRSMLDKVQGNWGGDWAVNVQLQKKMFNADEWRMKHVINHK